MQTTSNYGLKKPEGTDVVDIQNFNDNADVIDINMKTINDNSYPNVTATGTNAYVGTTDRIKALVKGTKLTLFVTLDATGNCTLNLNTYGVKNIKDSFGNIVTNMKKDIPYNLCYNGTDFILQGKGGGGNVTADKVLSGYTFTNDSGQGTGTMTNISADQTASTITQSGTTVSLTVPNGYWDGAKKLNASATAIDADIISGNIKSGAVICGIAGSSTVVDTANAVLYPQYLLAGYSGYDDGVLKAGTMINRSAENWHQPALGQTASDANGYGAYVIPPAGYYDGNSWVRSLQPDLLASNIVSGKNIFGILGTASNGDYKIITGISPIVSVANGGMRGINLYGVFAKTPLAVSGVYGWRFFKGSGVLDFSIYFYGASSPDRWVMGTGFSDGDYLITIDDTDYVSTANTVSWSAVVPV